MRRRGCGGFATVLLVLLVTAAALLTANCGQSPPLEQMTSDLPPEQRSTRAVDDDLAEEYEVYSALIQSMYIDAARPALIVIEDTTPVAQSPMFSPGDAVRAMQEQWSGLDEGVFADFETKNQTPLVLERRFTISVEYVLISERELESIFAGGSGWDDFYGKYPGSQGVLTLSRVGFSETNDTAVLYTGNQSHWEAGEGRVVLMKKTAGRWTVQSHRMLWIS